MAEAGEAICKASTEPALSATFGIFLSFDIAKNLVTAEMGGQDLFTSLAQLEVLWKNEIKVVKQMEETISKMETALGALKL